MLHFRSARLDDLDKLASIERSAASLFREAGLAWIAEGEPISLAELRACCQVGSIWVSVDERDEPVGFLAGYPLDGRFYIAEVSVSRPHQRQGIGKALLTTAIDHARASKIPSVTLTTYRDLDWNGPFYSKLGFVEIDPLEAGSGHREKLEAEIEAGHDGARRCLMAKPIG